MLKSSEYSLVTNLIYSKNIYWLPAACKVLLGALGIKKDKLDRNPALKGLLVYIFPGGASGKELASQCRRHNRHQFDPWVGKSSWGGHGNPLQYSCLENPMDREAWWATVHKAANSQTRLKWLSMHACANCKLSSSGATVYPRQAFRGQAEILRETMEYLLLAVTEYSLLMSPARNAVSKIYKAVTCTKLG